uniref:Neur_chan_memb domain-containing protein n=1 Tax=Steinernema glaseri TaxID=37863 RepID=A0A1I8AQB6_9BILA
MMRNDLEVCNREPNSTCTVVHNRRPKGSPKRAENQVNKGYSVPPKDGQVAENLCLLDPSSSSIFMKLNELDARIIRLVLITGATIYLLIVPAAADYSKGIIDETQK